ncbi:MAG: hypothetical protein ACFFBS_05410 [Promethearchaeota archaeon]
MDKDKKIKMNCNTDCPYLRRLCVSLPTAAETCCGAEDEAPTFKEDD